jgi:drug/metabolite transporter (DMT)-like permease
VFVLALVPGLAALLIYYRGLARTPASATTIAELAFPVSATMVNYVAFGALLTGTQWIGILTLVVAITWMSLLGTRDVRRTGVIAKPVLASG